MSRKSAYERRVTLALRWHHLENLDNEAIRQRFIDEGYGEFTPQTISGYLNSEAEDEVLKLIHEEQAHVREQSAERWERKHERSRQAEREATENQYAKALRPVTATNTGDRPIYVYGWDVITADDHRSPDWQQPHDVVVEFTDPGSLKIDPGERYYQADPSGNPEYRTVIVGIERDQPDIGRQQSLRTEQASHQREKATVLGAYEEKHHHTHEGAVAIGELSEEQEATFEKLTGAPGSGHGNDEDDDNAE